MHDACCALAYCIACFPAHAALLQAHYSRLHCNIACRTASLPTWNVTAEVLPISTNVETFTRNASAPKPQSPVSNAAVARAVPQAVATANAARHRNRQVCTRQHRRAALAVAVRCAAEQCMRYVCRSGSDPSLSWHGPPVLTMTVAATEVHSYLRCRAGCNTRR